MLRDYQKTDKVRNKKIYKLRKKGLTFAAIAEKVGLSRERTSQLYRKMEVLDKK
jgi:CRP-like cAMP-binding protein